MPTRLSKRKLEEAENLNSIAANIVAQTTGQDPPKLQPSPVREKNPFAVALGKLGARKGGQARAKALSSKRRKEIARKAASARWKE
jgi:hypothetical protein